MSTVRAFTAGHADDVWERRVVDLPVDELGDGDVLVRIQFSGINYKDGLAYEAGRVDAGTPSCRASTWPAWWRSPPTRRSPSAARCWPTATTSGWPTTAATPNWPCCRACGRCPCPPLWHVYGDAGRHGRVHRGDVRGRAAAPRAGAGERARVGHRGVGWRRVDGHRHAGRAGPRGGGQHGQARRGRLAALPGRHRRDGPQRAHARRRAPVGEGTVGRRRGLRRRGHAGPRAAHPALRGRPSPPAASRAAPRWPRRCSRSSCAAPPARHRQRADADRAGVPCGSASAPTSVRRGWTHWKPRSSASPCWPPS